MPISLNARAATYYQPIIRTEREEEYSQKASTKNLIQYQESKKYNGELSDRAKTKIKNYGANMILINSANIAHTNTPQATENPQEKRNTDSGAPNVQNVSGIKILNKKCKASFITLTLQSRQVHDDNTIKRQILQPFLSECKRLLNLKFYIWTAETQANGNIHFHIITPTYINKYILQTTWNKHAESLGYVSRSSSKNPPSTNVKGVNNTGKAIAYITKYLSKGNKDRRKIDGRLWGCDTQTEKLKNIIISQEEAKEIEHLITAAAIMEIRQEYFTTYILNIDKCKPLKLIIIRELLKLLADDC